jgi:hypothetical protein
VEKVKNSKTNAAQRKEARTARAIFRSKIGAECGGKIDAPGKEPEQVQKPESKARNGVVVARVAEIQKAQDVFIDEVEPEKSVILAGTAVHGEVEKRRHAAHGKDVPRGGE